MRAFSALLALAMASFLGLACQQLGTGEGTDAGVATDGGAATTSAEAGVVGGGCGVEQKSGTELCIATSMCPNVVVDTQAMPSCGFRVRGSAVDLLCACGTSLCPVGVFTSCAEAAKLLENQTEQSVCVQLAEGRCSESTAATTSSSSSSSSGGNPACDRQCVKDCGGGAACASICNCD